MTLKDFRNKDYFKKADCVEYFTPALKEIDTTKLSEVNYRKFLKSEIISHKCRNHDNLNILTVVVNYYGN